MKKSLFWAIATIAVLTVLTGCEKEDEDEIPSGDVNKGATLVKGVDGEDYYVVDLGFGFQNKLWATCNIGATSAEQYGEYFAWGEAETKNYFDWNKYSHCINGSRFKITKYSTDAENTNTNTSDNLKQLEADDDVATKRLGEEWSIPTKQDYEQLIYRCDWKCGKYNGVWGYLFTSKNNGNSIFIPLAGKRDLNELLFAESNGFYWSKELYDNKIAEYHNNNASILKLTKPTNPVNSSYEERYMGLPIRPIYKKKK